MADHTLRSAVLAATMASAACFAPAMHVRAAALRNTARSSPGLRLGGAHSSAFGTRIPAAAVNAAGRAGRGVQRSGLRMQVCMCVFASTLRHSVCMPATVFSLDKCSKACVACKPFVRAHTHPAFNRFSSGYALF